MQKSYKDRTTDLLSAEICTRLLCSKLLLPVANLLPKFYKLSAENSTQSSTFNDWCSLKNPFAVMIDCKHDTQLDRGICQPYIYIVDPPAISYVVTPPWLHVSH